MKLRLSPLALTLAAALSSLPALGQSVPAVEAPDASPETPLKPVPQLTPPALVTTPRQHGGPLIAPSPDSGVIFMRADRVTGTAEKFVEAEGKVELRTRTETVLADWLRYDFITEEIWGKGDVLIRRGIDWITGPEVRFQRGTETGSFKSPRFYIGQNGSRGSAQEIRFAGPDHYEATDARYTTCVAPRDDWYIRVGELEVDRARMIGTGHDATLYFLGAPVAYSPWVEFPLSNER